MYVYVISPSGSLATNELPVATKRSHLATKRSFLATSNLIRQWIKEQGIISICDSIWLGANSIKLSRCRGELGGGELTMGRNWQLPPIHLNPAIQTQVFQTQTISLGFALQSFTIDYFELPLFQTESSKKQDSTVFHIILLLRPMDFLQCDPPVDFKANETAREESGYGCTKVSSYNLH